MHVPHDEPRARTINDGAENTAHDHRARDNNSVGAGPGLFDEGEHAARGSIWALRDLDVKEGRELWERNAQLGLVGMSFLGKNKVGTSADV